MAKPTKPTSLARATAARTMMEGLAAKLAGAKPEQLTVKPKGRSGKAIRPAVKPKHAKLSAKPVLVVDNTEPAPKRKVRVGEMALARSTVRTRRRLEDRPLPRPFEMRAQFPKEAVPPAGMAMDEASMPGIGWAAQSWAASAFWEGQTFLGYPYLAELAQRPEYRRMVERIATEATRKWIRFAVATAGPPQEDGTPPKPDATLKGVDPDKTGKLRRIEDELKRLKVEAAFRELSEQDGYFGRAHLYIDTGDTENPEELKTSIGTGRDAVSAGKVTTEKPVLRLKTVEPMWCYPIGYNSNNPLRPDWYNPSSWFVMGKEVHGSRLLTFVSREVPDLLKPVYAFGGLSLTQMAKPYVDNWLRTRQSVSDLISNFSTMIFKTDMGSTLGQAGDELFTRMDFFNQLRDNKGLMAIDKNAEEVDIKAAPLGTLDALQAQSQEQMASVCGIPIVIYLGIQPMGLNASSEGEIRVFYDLIGAYQQSFFGAKLSRVIDFVQLSLWGEVDPDITFEFVELWSMTAKELAEVRKLDAETDQILIDGGVLHPEESRKRIAADPASPHASIDVEDVPEPPEEEMPPGMGGGGGFGPFGGGLPKAANDAAGREAAFDGVGPFVVHDEWSESDHPRGQPGNAGQFGSGGGGGKTAHAGQEGGGEQAAKSEAKPEPRAAESDDSAEPIFKTKKEHAAHLLERGTTAKELMEKLGWPSISVPATAKSVGMKLTKVKEGKTTKYIGTPMTAAERKAAGLMPEGVRRSGGPAARDPETFSLMEFIASRGGIDPKDPLIGDVRSLLGTKNKFVPGFGSLVRPGGLRLDRLREAAVEAGYIEDQGRHDGGLAISTIDTLLQSMDREARGERQYRQGVDPEAGRREEDAQEENRRHYDGLLDEELTASGVDPATITGKQRERVLQIMEKEGITDPLEALEREAMEWVNDAAEQGTAERILDEIPGWDVPPHAGPASKSSGAAAPF